VNREAFFKPILVLSSLLLLGQTPTASPKDLEIMVENAAEPWSNPDGTGYANDIVTAAFKEMGVDVHLKVVPYSRCKAAAIDGSITACVSMTWLPEFKGRIQLASKPLIILDADIFENVHSPLPKTPNRKCKLPSGSRLGTVIGYEYPKEVMNLQNQGVILESVNSDSQNINKLARKRIDAAVVITNRHEPKNKKVLKEHQEANVRRAFNCGTETGTIGFSLKNSDGSWARKLFETGYRKIVQKGILAKIEKKWFGH
jgi:ABC-type amino acid transport substrate-binding protein